MIYMAFDTETGGLVPQQGDLLTCYMAIFDEDFKMLEELDLKLKPDGGAFPRADAGALRVNKIDLQAHMSDPNTKTYSEGKALVKAFLGRHHKKIGRFNNLRPLGYNVDFDIRFVQFHLLPEVEWNEFLHYGKIDPKGYVDLFKDSGWWPRDVGTLESVVDLMGIPKRPAHNAKEDTLMTVDVYKKMIELMKSKKENGSSQDLISLLEAE
jgi:hypothetical protein